MRRIMRAAVLLAAASAVTGASAQSQGGQTIAIVDAMVFDGTGAAPTKATVIIRDGLIADVGPGLKAPAGATVVQAQGKALLPGFFDLHTHWNNSGGSIPQTAQAYVKAGVTSINDFHQPPESYEPRRRWLSGLTTPHVTFTARTSTPGGHGADWGDQSTTKWVDTPESARMAIRELVPYKIGAVKAFQDGWRYGQSQDNTSMDVQTLAALVDEAHKNNLKVLTHTVTVERGRQAGIAKVDVIAHSLQDREVDAATIKAIKDNGTFYAPTLAVYEPVKPGQPQPAQRNEQSFRKFGYALHNVKALHDAGVPIAVATDAGMPGTPHGPATLREMELLVQAGLTPTEALVAGTSTSARAMNQMDRGVIQKGKRADLVLINGAPWTNIADIRKTEQVFIDGKPAFGPLAKPTPADGRPLMPALKAKAVIDDFEGAVGRTTLDTLRIDAMDGGRERTEQVTQVVSRENGSGKALMVSAKMARKEQPQAGVTFPLSRGGVEPVDASAFKGVRFDVRGDGGPITMAVGSSNGRFSAPVTAGAAWTTVEIPFSELKAGGGRGGANATPPQWSGASLIDVGFQGSRKAGETLWMQLDNVTFY